MAKMGRKPRPTELRVIEGNPGNRPIPPTVKPPIPSRPQSPPAHLTTEAKSEWKRLAPVIHKIGLLTAMDRAVFAAYCQAYGDWVVGQKMLNELRAKGGAGAMLSKTSNGNIIQNPLVGVVNQARRDMVRFGEQLGLSPSARTQVAAHDPRTAAPQEGSGRFFRKG